MIIAACNMQQLHMKPQLK